MKKYIGFFSLLVLFSCCKENNAAKNFFRGTVKCIDFSGEYFLSGEIIDVDSIGVARVETFGSYLMLINYRQPYFLQVYTAYSDGYQYSGRFFRKGKGPKDFLGFQVIKKEYPCLWIQDYMNKHVKKINIEQGFDDRSFIIEKIYSYKKTVDPFNVFYLSDTCFLIKDYDVNKGLYYLKYNPEKESISSEEFILYNYPVTYPLMNKMLTLADVLHPRGNKIASITGVFNQIDILNLDNPDKNISVTTNQKPVKYQDVMNTGKEDFQEYYFSYPVCNEQMIFVLYHSQDANKPVQIHVIDWDGNPVAKLHLDKNIRDIHIDFNEKIIYGIEDESERVYKFNIKTGNFRLLG